MERYFGKEHELQGAFDGYEVAWKRDLVDPSSRPGSDGESVQDVAARVKAFLQVRGMWGVGHVAASSGDSRGVDGQRLLWRQQGLQQAVPMRPVLGKVFWVRSE